jgi:hypothetical protein
MSIKPMSIPTNHFGRKIYHEGKIVLQKRGTVRKGKAELL